MRFRTVGLLVLWVSSAGGAEDAAAQEDTATLWAALRSGGHVERWCGTERLPASRMPGSGSTTARPNAISESLWISWSYQTGEIKSFHQRL